MRTDEIREIKHYLQDLIVDEFNPTMQLIAVSGKVYDVDENSTASWANDEGSLEFITIYQDAKNITFVQLSQEEAIIITEH